MRITMKTLGALAITGMAALSVSTASAWWGGPWGDRGYNNWNNLSDWMGDGTGDADFNMYMRGRGDSRARGYGYNRYNRYRGYYPPPWAYGPRANVPGAAPQPPQGPGTPGPGMRMGPPDGRGPGMMGNMPRGQGPGMGRGPMRQGQPGGPQMGPGGMGRGPGGMMGKGPKGPAGPAPRK